MIIIRILLAIRSRSSLCIDKYNEGSTLAAARFGSHDDDVAAAQLRSAGTRHNPMSDDDTNQTQTQTQRLISDTHTISSDQRVVIYDK
jgi:hypothetical protein